VVRDSRVGSDSSLIVFAGGGTGGHLYPALALADALRGRVPRVRFLFFATDRGIDHRVLERVDAELFRQNLPPLRGAPWRWPGALAALRRACRACRSCFASDRPGVVIGTGGLSSVPAVLEARRADVPVALLNPDAVPGRANRLLARLAEAVFAQWEDTAAHLPRGVNVLACGCPIRAAFFQVNRRAAIDRFRLRHDRKTLLVTGASQGARSINEAVMASLAGLGRFSDWQVLHLTGDLDLARVQAAYRHCDLPAVVLPFTHDMPLALCAADLVVSRAGASTLAEISAVGVPSVLMPYPFHRDMHQLANARCLERVGAARIVKDAINPAINGPALLAVLEELMVDDDTRQAMAAAARRGGQAGAAETIADAVWALARRQEGGSPRVASRRVEQTCAPAR